MLLGCQGCLGVIRDQSKKILKKCINESFGWLKSLIFHVLCRDYFRGFPTFLVESKYISSHYLSSSVLINISLQPSGTNLWYIYCSKYQRSTILGCKDISIRQLVLGLVGKKDYKVKFSRNCAYNDVEMQKEWLPVFLKEISQFLDFVFKKIWFLKIYVLMFLIWID